MKKFITSFLLSTFVLNCFATDGFLDGLKNTIGKKDKQLIIFYRPDCPYCDKMDKVVKEDPLFQQKITQNFTVQVFNISTPEGRLMADKFNVHAVPSIINFNVADGSFTGIKGFAGTQKLLTLLGLAEPGNEMPAEKNNSLTNKASIQNTFAVCGDGIIEAGEGCDDGNTVPGDGCNASCNVEPGFSCTGSPSVCSTVCGDGIIAVGEGCDDGNTVSGDGCTNTCNIEPGYSCTGTPSLCSNAPPGNDDCVGAILLPGTAGTVGGQNATATNSTGVFAPSCQATTNKDVWYRFTLASSKNVRIEVNGPSVTDPVLAVYSGSCGTLSEVACDDDSGPDTYSLLQATLNAGTYFVRVGTFNATTAGTFSLVYNLNIPAICGNNIIETGEECDDGNTVNGDNCSNVCLIENASTSKGVSVNEDAVRAHPSAMLDVKSTERGVLIPRMNTAQRTAITAPAKGLLVFDISSNTFWFYNGTGWTEVGGASGTAGSGLPAGTANQTLRNNGTNWLANNVLQNDGTNVTVTGQLKINGGAPAAGRVLTSDASGLGSWQAPAGGSVAFSVKADSNRTIIHGAPAIRLHFGNYGTAHGNYNTGAFNSATDEFVAPSAGLYSFTIDIYAEPLAASNVNISNEIRVVNSSNVITSQQAFIDVVPMGTLTNSYSHTSVFNLNAGDKVFVLSSKFNGGGSSNVVISYGFGGIAATRLTGYKIN